MTVITANVLAAEVWSTIAQGSRRTGQRTLRLDQQWHRHGAHIIGVQEARTAAGQYHSPHYRIFASGATVARAPLYGCELWIHKTKPIAHDQQGTPITLGDAKVTIRHADPRRLIAVASIGKADYTFVVLHAPCQATQHADTQQDGDLVERWWSDTSVIWTNTVTTTLCWVMIDANAPVDGAHGHSTGPLGAEPSSRAGKCFLQFLVDQDLALPCTFPYIHEGPTTTWSHATGKQSRKDYIAIPAKMMQLAQRSWVDIRHDNTFAHDDHLPVILECQGWQPLPPKEATVRWDPEKMLDPQCCQAFQQALTTLPIPHWSVDVDDHAAIQEAQILQLGQQFFAKKPRRSHKITLQPDTLALIVLKRQALDYGRANHELTHPPFKQELRQLEKEVRRKVRRDTQVFYDALLDQLDQAGELHNHRLMYQLLTRLGRKKGGKPPGPRPLPMLKKPDGSLAATYTEQQHIWMTQFAAVEAGVPCSWPQLQQCHRDLSESHQVGVQDIDPAAFPTVWQVQCLISKLKRDKVPGPNQIPPALLKAGGEVMARHLTIIFAKAAAAAREPLLWKGGTLIPLWKGKESPDLPSAYRSIFVSNYSTKLYHQFVRQHLVAIWERKADQLQCGGRKGVGVDVAHHVIQCQKAWTTANAIPSAILYIDLRAAFYTVIRQTFTSLPCKNQAFMQAMETLGIPLQDIAELLAAAETECVTQGLSNHLQKMLHDMMTNTFFTIPGLNDPCHTTRGTRPGDPVADVLFNMCITSLLTSFRTCMAECCTTPWLGNEAPIQDFGTADPLPAEGYIDVTFVDDCALLVHATTNQRIEEVIIALVTSFDAAARSRGLQVNFNRGKTELLWNVVGKGAKATKQSLYEQGNQLIWEHQGRQYKLHICHAYKHLGTWTQTKHRHAREVLARASAARQQWGQLARPFFRRPLSLATKVRVFQALVISKMLYNVHTWAGARKEELERWNNYMRGPIALLMKGVLAPQRKFRHTTDTLCAWCGMLPLPQQVHLNRLRFAKRLFQRCPAITWRLLLADNGPCSWLAAFQDSCQWMQLHYDKPHLLPASTSHEAWIQHICLDAHWKGRVRKTGRLALHYNSAQAEHAIWQHNFEATLQQAGATLPEDPVPYATDERWQCDLCTKVIICQQACVSNACQQRPWIPQKGPVLCSRHHLPGVWTVVPYT